MASTRTHVYLTAEQRRKLDDLARRENRSMGELVREAIDRYLSGPPSIRPRRSGLRSVGCRISRFRPATSGANVAELLCGIDAPE